MTETIAELRCKFPGDDNWRFSKNLIEGQKNKTEIDLKGLSIRFNYGMTHNNRRRYGMFEAMVIPIRTDNFEAFCKDFFLPNFVNYALKTDDLAIKIIAGVAFFCVDIATLPIRCISALPRYLSNAKRIKEENIVYQTLKEFGVPDEVLNQNSLIIEYVKHSTYAQKNQKTDQDELIETTRQYLTKTTATKSFNFIELRKDHEKYDIRNKEDKQILKVPTKDSEVIYDKMGLIVTSKKTSGIAELKCKPHRKNDWNFSKLLDTENEITEESKTLNKTLLEHSQRRCGMFEAMIIPIRTHNREDFCKDFFLPNFVNYALKADDLAIQIIAGFAFFCVDIATLPIRCITALPRYLVNSTRAKESNPLYTYLKENNASDLLNEDALNISYEQHVKYPKLIQAELTGNGDLTLEVQQQVDKTIKKGTYNFIQLPKNHQTYQFHVEDTKTIKTNDLIDSNAFKEKMIIIAKQTDKASDIPMQPININDEETTS